MDRSIKGANLVVREIKQGEALEEEVTNAIQMFDKCLTDAEQARTKADDVLT